MDRPKGARSIVFLLLNSLYYSSQALNHVRGEKQYAYDLGNVFHSLSILTHNPVGQWGLGTIYSLFPLSTQLLFRVTNESAKVFKIHNDFAQSFPQAPRYCNSRDTYQCFKDLFGMINATCPFTNTGTILMVAVGAKITFDQKDQTEKKGVKPDPTQYALQIVEVTLLAHRGLLSGGSFRNKLIGYPKTEVDHITPENVRAISKLDQNIKMKNWITDLFFFGLRKDNMIDGLSNQVVEAALLARLDNDITGKFYNVSKSKTFELLNVIEKKGDACVGECQELVRKYRKDLQQIEKDYKDLGII